jgi:hypothetical protein
MEYAAEMGSGAMIYIPSFIKIGSEGMHGQHGNRITLFLAYFPYFEK